MPFEIQWENQLFICQLRGSVPLWEMEAVQSRFSDDSRCDTCRFLLFDGSEIERFTFVQEQVARIVGNDIGLSFYLKDLTLVFVASKPEVLDIFEQYVSLCTLMKMPWSFHICDTMEEARTWISAQQGPTKAFSS